MLEKLSIQNYAIIDELEIDFSGKLNVITGETGAGKSIIVGALGLILGDRADSTALVNKQKKCIIEGVFNAEGKKAIFDFLKESELDADQELVLRREINVNGKSRSFINDTPVNLSQLQAISILLVDLHQQFDTLELGESNFQREVLDALAGNSDLLAAYQTIYRHWHLVNKDLEKLQTHKQQFDKEADYNKFQFDELEEAAFKIDELESLEVEIKMLSNAEAIKETLSKVYFDLQESENPVVQQLKILLQQLQHFSTYHPDLPVLVSRLQSTQIELQDIADDLDRISNHINYDAQKLAQYNERLSIGYKLQKKHGVNSTNELLDIQQQLQEKLQAVLNIDETILQKQDEAKNLLGKAVQLAKKIATNRQKQSKPLEEKVNKLLVQVGMPNAKLKVDCKPAEINLFGIDAIEFLFNANIAPNKGVSSPPDESKNGHFQPVGKVASGGELSRLMLCIKSLVAKTVDLPTLIFDEIDTGISGEAARQVGLILKNLAASRQVICITHQPQIAGKADTHFFVYKEIVEDAVKTSIRPLTVEERIITIAKMLSGEKPTAAAIENAREMVKN